MNKEKIIVTLVFLNLVWTKAYLQKFDFGLIVQTNISSQTNIDPTKPEDGQFQWNSLNTFGAGVYFSKQIFDKIYFSGNLIYNQKGYNEEAQTGILFTPEPIPFSYPSLQNRFNYISLEINSKYLRNKSKKIKISPIIGLSANTLLSRNLESERLYPVNEFYPVNLYKDNWKKFNFGYLIGLSLYQIQKYSLDFEFNRSISPLLSLDTLVVKDWTWSLKLNVSFQKLFSSDIKEK